MHDPSWKFPALRDLTVSLRGGYTCRAKSLVAMVAKLQALKSLYLNGVNLSDEDTGTLFEALKALPLLASLAIFPSRLGAHMCRPIGNLVALGRLQKLDLGFNRLGDEGISAMVDAIFADGRNRCELRELHLSNNEIGSSGGEKIADLVARSPRLRELDLSANPVGEAIVAVRLVSSLKLSAHVMERLDVSNCILETRGVRAVLNGLHAFLELKALTIGFNDAKSLDAQAITAFLLSSGGRKLTELSLHMSNITEACALELAGAFAKTYSLRSITMDLNPLGPRGAAAIIDALATVSTLPMDTISFLNCEMEDAGASAVGRLISRRGCNYAYLSSNEIHLAGAKAIADSVAATCTTIEYLLLAQNSIGDEGVRYFLDEITRHRSRTVRRLNISGAGIGAEGAMAAKRVVEADGLLTQLVVSRCGGDGKADGVLEAVKKWECASKSVGAATLVLL